MGMDVYGRNPSNKTGEYFRANIFNWPKYVAVVNKVWPELNTQSWMTNDGDGLDAKDTVALATRLERYLVLHVGAFPPPSSEPHMGHLVLEALTKHGSTVTYCGDTDLTVEKLTQFLAFLRNCGGFHIY